MFPEILRSLLEERGVSVAELARHVKCSPTEVLAWLDGRKEPRCGKVVSLALYFNVSMDYISGFEEYRKKKESGRG